MKPTAPKKSDLQPKWLINDHDWVELSKHPQVQPDDFAWFNLIAVMSRYMIILPTKQKYTKIRRELQTTRRYEEASRNRLSQILKNDDIFLAIKSEVDLMKIAWEFFEPYKILPEEIRDNLRAELQNKDRLLRTYDMMIGRLGGIGRKGNEALSLLIRHLNLFAYWRRSKPLSRSNIDISLVGRLYKIASGHNLSKQTVSNKIKELHKNWNASEVERLSDEMAPR
jgi:hypothetical protein